MMPLHLVQAGGCAAPASQDGQGNGSSTEMFLQHEAVSCRTADAGLQLAPAAKRQLFQGGSAISGAHQSEGEAAAVAQAEPSCTGPGTISGELNAAALLACS